MLPVNCLRLTEEEILRVLTTVLYEFPLRRVEIALPGWFSSLQQTDPLRSALPEAARAAALNARRVRELDQFRAALTAVETVTSAQTDRVELGAGTARLTVSIEPAVFYRMIGQITGMTVGSDGELVDAVRALSAVRDKYDRISAALEQVNSTGYGIVMPQVDELTLEEPEIVRQGNRYGVKLKASAPSIHMLRADIKTEVAPIVGSEKQSEDLVKYLLDGFKEDPSKIWESNIFGKSLDDLVKEGLRAKLTHMPSEARMKLQQTLERVINEGCNGLICIII